MSTNIGEVDKSNSFFRWFHAIAKKLLPTCFVMFASKIKKINLLLSLKVVLSSNYLLSYWHDIYNFGDRLNPVLIKLLSGREVVHSSKVINIAGKPIYVSIGSILKEVHSKHSVIWGAGFMDSKDFMAQVPRKIAAVRGPLSRKKLLESGIDCPEIYGDPALLLPLLFNPTRTGQYKLGIVPHYVDKKNAFLEYIHGRSDILIIDIEDAVPRLISNINKCETIASSSLHGLIVADAYGIPSIWIKLSNNLGGDDFKFHDYFSSVGRKEMTPFYISKHTTIESLIALRKECKIEIDREKLLTSCPFLDKRMEEKLKELIPFNKGGCLKY